MKQEASGLDPEAIHRNKYLYVAVLTVGVGVLELRSSTANGEWYWLVFVIAVVAIAFRMIRGARCFESTSGQNNLN
ncbi:hypothetical protein [Halopenitus persicus]|uniref:hypothetical protein n=1 Tax=Halopenitus persicus TaxID=1048396 RepID=UPI0011608DD4|nr:hypothetical protein [Halopenitus persicus]